MKAVQVKTFYMGRDGKYHLGPDVVISGGICFSIPMTESIEFFDIQYCDLPVTDSGIVELVYMYFSGHEEPARVLRDDFDKLVAELD